MVPSRIFLSQESLDNWLTSEDVTIEQDELHIPGLGARFRIKTALYFVDEVTGSADEAALVGKVQDLDQLASQGGEHCADSVILGDNAYQVVEGFAAEFLDQETAPAAQDWHTDDPTLAAVGKRLLET